MAPPGIEFDAEELNKIPLPHCFHCQECRRDKDPSMFAKKYHREYRFKKMINVRFVPTARNTKMRCRKCTGEQVHELQCEGQCGLWKTLDGFSKNSRSRGEYWCKECVLWKTSLEPGQDVTRGPGQDLAPDEVVNDRPGTAGVWDPEGAGDDDDDDEYEYEGSYAPVAPKWGLGGKAADIADSGMASLSLNDTETVASGDYIPPFLRGQTTSAAPSPVATRIGLLPASTTPASIPGDYVPPHLRGVASKTTASSVSNPYEDQQSVKSTSTVGQPVKFTGFDPMGQAHIQYRMPSGVVTTKAPSLRSITHTSSHGTASRPVGRPANQSAAAVTPAVPVASNDPASRGNWAKPQGSAKGGREGKYVAGRGPAPATRNRGGYDSDGSLDEM